MTAARGREDVDRAPPTGVAWLDRPRRGRGGRPIIIDELRAIQGEQGYLSVDALRALAERLQLPLYHVQGVASFFPHFRLSKPPAVDVRVCADMSCHLRGAGALRRSIEEGAARAGWKDVVIRAASCLGQCDRAPAAAVNHAILGRLTPASLASHVVTALAGADLPVPELSASTGRLAIDPYDGDRPYQALRTLLETRDFDGLIAKVEKSGLRGLGGAGFPTATKWSYVRKKAAGVKYVVCNADESEPGTIKDRFLMDLVPHLIVEGTILAGITIGARRGIIYVRHEYRPQIDAIHRELEACTRQGLVGPDVLGSGIAFELSVFESPGGYICGEETALYEVLEGKRAEPRNKPPRSVDFGLEGQPTVMNNVETLAMVPAIALGGAHFPGVKYVGVSGHVGSPGVYPIAMGTTVRTVIERAGGVLGGRPLKAFACSGASSGFLPASMIDTPLEFGPQTKLAKLGSMLGSGAIVICAEGTCMLDMALNGVRFFRNESCGKCVPCRVGTMKLTDILTDVAAGRGRPEHLALIGDLAHAMAEASICGLGQFAPAPITSVIRHFREEVEAHVRDGRCPSGVCPMTG